VGALKLYKRENNTSVKGALGLYVGFKKGCAGAYRYGFNGQEKVDEISGVGNHNTALFWEYDTRLGRRWNLDPVVKHSLSGFSTFGNNPIVCTDVNGDDSTSATLGGGRSSTSAVVPQPNQLPSNPYNPVTPSNNGNPLYVKYGFGYKDAVLSTSSNGKVDLTKQTLAKSTQPQKDDVVDQTGSTIVNSSSTNDFPGLATIQKIYSPVQANQTINEREFLVKNELFNANVRVRYTEIITDIEGGKGYAGVKIQLRTCINIHGQIISNSYRIGLEAKFDLKDNNLKVTPAIGGFGPWVNSVYKLPAIPLYNSALK
jgi:hypothetical protein